MNGIRGFKAKIKRLEQGGIPRYRTAEESGKNRSRKKIMGKSTWFKGGGSKINMRIRSHGGKGGVEGITAEQILRQELFYL